MATCKDCLHHDVCAKFMPGIGVLETTCSDFTNKSEWVHLPCKEGDTVYCVFSPPCPANPNDKGKWFMDEFEVCQFYYGVMGLSIEIWNYGSVNEDEIGKTVFLTREEAEKALAERRRE